MLVATRWSHHAGKRHPTWPLSTPDPGAGHPADKTDGQSHQRELKKVGHRASCLADAPVSPTPQRG